jgi:hypothetical protein
MLISPYFQLFNHELDLLTSIWWDAMAINLYDPYVWLQVCEHVSMWQILFKYVTSSSILMCNDNGYGQSFWHQKMLCHAIIWGHGYQPWVHIFELGNYVYWQQIIPIMLDMTIGHVILHVWKVLLFAMLLLDGWTYCNNHMCICAPCHHSHVHGQINPFFGWLFLLDYVICCMGSLSLTCNYVDLWSKFKTLACGMSYATIGRHICCKMILALVHYANLCTYSYN